MLLAVKFDIKVGSTLDSTLDQGLSKRQEVGFTPVTKIPKFILVFWDPLGAIQKQILKDKFGTDHIKNL